MQKINKEVKRDILLNPGPATTSVKVKEAMIVTDICPREREFGALIEKVTATLKKVCNAADDLYETVLLGGSGTGAIEACLSSSIAADSNDKILIIENGAYGLRMEQICQTYQIPYHKMKFSWEGPIDTEVVAKHLADHASEYRVMAFIHHETTSGVLNPLEELCALAKKYELKSMVDAMSSYAGIVIDQTANEIDYLISSSNKCIQGMAGIGIAIVAKAELKTIESFKKRSFYFDLTKNYNSQAKGGQFAFTPPVQVLYALDAAIEEFFAEGGQEERAARYAALYEKMYTGMLEFGFRPVVEEKVHSKILTSFFYKDDSRFSFEELHSFFYERGVTIYPGKVSDIDSFRISNIGDLTLEDIDTFLNLMKEYLTRFE